MCQLLEHLEISVTVSFDPQSGDFIVPFEDDKIRNSRFIRRIAAVSLSQDDSDSKLDSNRIRGSVSAEEEEQLQDEYSNRCLLWTANANSIVVRYLLKLISNLCVGARSDEHVDSVKAVLRRLIKSDDTSAVFGAMLEGNDILAFYFRLIMQHSTSPPLVAGASSP